MKRNLFITCALLIVLGLSSCTHRLTDFTVISTKNVPLGKNAATMQKANQRVKGVDKSHMVLFIPFGSPNMKEAIDKAIEKYPGAVGLADGVIKSKSMWFLLYGQNSYIVEGTPIYETTPEAKEVATDNAQNGETMVFFHEVKNGETIADIAKTYNVSVADIIKWNKLSSADAIVGEKLKILVK